MTHDHSTPDPLKRSMVHLADTVRTLHVIGTRIRTGLSSTKLPDPVFRDYDYVGSTHGSNNDRDNPVKDHIIYGLYNQKIKPRKRASYSPYL